MVEEEIVMQELVACSSCGRKFASDQVDKHMSICGKEEGLYVIKGAASAKACDGESAEGRKKKFATFDTKGLTEAEVEEKLQSRLGYNGDTGTIGVNELKAAMQELNCNDKYLEPSKLNHMIQELDKDGSGRINLDDFIRFEEEDQSPPQSSCLSALVNVKLVLFRLHAWATAASVLLVGVLLMFTLFN